MRPADFAADAVRTFSVRVAVWNFPAQALVFPAWDARTRYIDALYEDGGIEIDNNAAESSLRGVALVRKNYYSLDQPVNCIKDADAAELESRSCGPRSFLGSSASKKACSEFL